MGSYMTSKCFLNWKQGSQKCLSSQSTQYINQILALPSVHPLGVTATILAAVSRDHVQVLAHLQPTPWKAIDLCIPRAEQHQLALCPYSPVHSKANGPHSLPSMVSWWPALAASLPVAQCPTWQHRYTTPPSLQATVSIPLIGHQIQRLILPCRYWSTEQESQHWSNMNTNRCQSSVISPPVANKVAI